MSNRTFEQILADFEALMQELVSVDQVVEEVIFGRGESTAGHPYLRFFIISIDTRHVSQRDYRRGWGFRIEIVQESSQKNFRQAEIDLGNAIDALFNKLETNWDLGGDIIDDIAGTTGEDTRADGKVITASFTAVPRTFTKN